MTEKCAEDRLRRLSEAAIFAEPSDPKALADLHTEFEDLEKWAVETSNETIAAAAKASAALVEKLILEEVTDPQAAMEVVNRGISAIQAVLRDGRDLVQADFPTELQLTKPPAGAQRATAGLPPLPPAVDEAIFAEFLERQDSVLEEMEELVMALENGGEPDKPAQLRRLVHTLKGESALLALGDVERLCHTIEDTLDNGGYQGLTDILLEARDWLKRTFDSYSGKGSPPEPVAPLLQRLAAVLSPPQPGPPPEGPPSAPQDAPPGTPAEIRAETPPSAPSQPPAEAKPLEGDAALLGEFISEAEEHLASADEHLLVLEAEPQHEEAMNAVFRAFHTIKGVSGFLALDEIQRLSHEAENLLDKARKGELLLSGEAIDVTFAAVDMLKRLIQKVATALSTGGLMAPEGSLPQLLTRIHGASSGKAQPAPAPASLQPVAPPVEAQAAPEAEDEDSAAEVPAQDGSASPAPSAPSQTGAPSRQAMVKVKEAVKVDADRLDRLVDTIGELVIAESMVSQSIGATDAASAQIGRHLGQLDKITRELQEMGMSLRMVPIRSTFQKMARLARDLGKKTGKRVQFIAEGEDTELDKTVVDRIGDPLVHMVRNAVDHGIEATPEDRRKAGKSETARIVLRAFHKGGNIHIEVEDDGRGLNRQAILRKAREKGLIRDGESMSDREVWNLIFAPGFSTAAQVTEVSGRGVGMDVVRRNIDALRGQVDIRSEWGKGSTFSIRLPLTLAIIDGMVVRVGKERYIIPTLSIVRTVRPEDGDISTVLNRGEMISLEGRLIPLFRLDRLFEIAGAEKDPTKAVVVIVEDDGKQTGLLTDELLGQQQIVIKSLGEAMRNIPGVAGGAIMPDGLVGLILDIGGLVRLANAEKEAGPVEEGARESAVAPEAVASGAAASV